MTHYCYIPIRMAKIKNCDNADIGKDVKKFYHLYIAGENEKW